MEGMEDSKKPESHLTSAAAFVEGGIQDPCDDACSICLEEFCDSDPSTVTTCKHEFHLQCVLEWCQRSSQCPMCWQAISLKDPTSQELLEAVERERNIRLTPPRTSAIFHHPTLGDFELQHLPVGINEAELEERIIQHLAAAAAMGRRHVARRDRDRDRDSSRNRSSSQSRPQYVMFSNHVNTPTSTSPPQRGEVEPVPMGTLATPSSPARNIGDSSSLPDTGESNWQVVTPSSTGSHANSPSASGSGSGVLIGHHGSSPNNGSPNHSSPNSQDRAGPSEFQSISESIKSKLNAVSSRYKESISKSTRGWKERFFSRNSAVADLSSDVRREVNAGIATVSRMMERLDARESPSPSPRTSTSSGPNRGEDNPVSNNEHISEAGAMGTGTGTTNMQASPAAASSGTIE
ncbi:E3 ubiquitin-protein ligase RHF2A [Linum grandiflorum]